MGEMPATVAWTVFWPGLLPWVVAAILPLLVAAWSLRDPARVRWAATELVTAAARRAGFDRHGLPWLLLAARVTVLATIALAAARPFLTPAAPAVGVPLVGGSADRRIEIVVTDPATPVGTGADSSLALRRAVAALATTSSMLAQPGVPAVDMMSLRNAGAAFAGRRLIVLCDGAVPDAADGQRLADAIRGGSALLVCLGPDSTAPSRRQQLSAWLHDLADIDVEGAVPLDDAAIDTGTVITAAERSMLVGPSVNTIAAVSFDAPQWTVRARTAADGRPLVLEASVGKGRLCVATIPLAIETGANANAPWSDVAAWPAFLPFIDALASSLLDPPTAPTPATMTTRRFMGLPLARPLLGVALVAAICEWLLASSRMASGLGRRRWLTGVSRLALLLLAGGMFLAWGGRPREQPGAAATPQPVAILIDSSPSMETSDVVTTSGPRSRLAAIREALAADDDRLLQAVGKGRSLQTNTIDSPLGAAIEQLATAATPPATIIVASDGAIAGGDSWRDVARLLAQRRIPLVAVPVGDSRLTGEQLVPWGFRFTAIDVPTVCRPDDRIMASVRAAAATPHDRPLPLRAEGGEGELTAIDNGDREPFDYRFAGHCRDLVHVDSLPDKSIMQTRSIRLADSQRHTATYPVVITREPVRVLLVDSRPRFEFRFLERLLAANDRFEVTSCLLTEDGLDDRRPTAALPTSTDEWLAYDVVVLGDISIAAATGGTATSWEALRDAAERDGIGIAWTPGRHWARDDAGLRSWLPATPGDGALAAAVPRRLAVSAAGRTLGAFRWLNDRPSDAPPFAPEIFAALEGISLAPTARVVAFASGPDRSPILPAVIADRLGAATIVGHLAETWRWRDGDGGDAHAWYWSHLLTQLAEPRRLARLTAAVLAVRPCDPVAGEPLWIDVIPTRRDTRLAGWWIDLAGEEESSRRIEVPPLADGAAATIPLPGLVAGRHTLRLVPPKQSSIDGPRMSIIREIIVNEPTLETAGGPAGTGPLAAAATATGGEVVPLDQLDTLPAAVARAESRRRAAVAAAGPRWFESQLVAHLLVAAAVAAGMTAWWPREGDAA